MAVSLGVRLAKKNGAMPIEQLRRDSLHAVRAKLSMMLPKRGARHGKGIILRVCERLVIALRAMRAALCLMPSKKDCCIIPQNCPALIVEYPQMITTTSMATKQNTGSK